MVSGNTGGLSLVLDLDAPGLMCAGLQRTGMKPNSMKYPWICHLSNYFGMPDEINCFNLLGTLPLLPRLEGHTCFSLWSPVHISIAYVFSNTSLFTARGLHSKPSSLLKGINNLALISRAASGIWVITENAATFRKDVTLSNLRALRRSQGLLLSVENLTRIVGTGSTAVTVITEDAAALGENDIAFGDFLSRSVSSSKCCKSWEIYIVCNGDGRVLGWHSQGRGQEGADDGSGETHGE